MAAFSDVLSGMCERHLVVRLLHYVLYFRAVVRIVCRIGSGLSCAFSVSVQPRNLELASLLQGHDRRVRSRLAVEAGG